MPHPKSLRRRLAGFAIAGALLAGGLPARADEAVTLLKVVSKHDEATIGLTAHELDRMGTGSAAERVSATLTRNGTVSAWRYSVRKAANGDSQLAATQRVALLSGGTTRVEPYTQPFAVVPPQAGAAKATKLFKLVTAQEEITFGLPQAELGALGPGDSIDTLATRLATAKELSVVQYAVGRGEGGALEQKPQKRIVLRLADAIRIEPFDSPLPVAEAK